ncbi:hypothetical protein RRG08_045989 [Elysia crispata]|uniref:Sushi domain-containing protein n=1 Tax=Elysia crispata TaxID=231223 RepID=A0AAE0Z075_9GAST|nr:hypothetical protein RRG08_045989 [Elysia crispata]
MSNCTLESSVNNAVATLSNYTSDLVMASYQCLTGFSLAGDSRIFCNTTEGAWQQAPRCFVIQPKVDVNVNVSTSSGVSAWFLYFLAIFLIALIAVVILVSIWCFLRPPCQTVYLQEARYYKQDSKQDNDEVFSLKSSRDSIFWVDKTEPTPREAPVYRKPVPPAKDLIKEGKWMPHRNSIRSINTSTK